MVRLRSRPAPASFWTLLVLVSGLGLAACATYTPQPLGDGRAVLDAPDPRILATATATLERPFLRPVAVDLATPLDANAIGAVAVVANPDLKAARARAGIAEAQVFAARLVPDPVFSVGYVPVVSGPDMYADFARALTLDLAALRTREVRVAQASASQQQVRLDLAWTEWQTVGQARVQEARVLGLTRILELGLATRAAARSLLERTLRAAGRGDLNPDQVQAARLAAFDSEERVRVTERDLAAARLQLTQLLGLPPSTMLSLAPVPLPAPPPDAATLFTIARRQRADIQALARGYDAQEAAVRLAVLQQFPTLNLAINDNRDTTGNHLIGPTVDFTVPLWNRNQGGLRVERATRDALRAEYDARLFTTRATIAAAVAGLTIARRQYDAAALSLPALQRFAGATRRAADRGDLPLATAETAEQALRDKQTVLAQTAQDMAEQTVALEMLTGVPHEDWTA